MDRGAWWATVHGVSKSRTRLSNLTSLHFIYKDGKNTGTNCILKKDLNEPDYYNGVVNHPEPDILECEVKWALRSIAVNKANGCDEIPAELFKSLKDGGFVFIIPANLEDPEVATGLEKVNPHSSSQEGQYQRMC